MEGFPKYFNILWYYNYPTQAVSITELGNKVFQGSQQLIKEKKSSQNF